MSWIDAGTRHFEAAGLPPGTARSLVTGLLAALEGSFVLCRALRDTEPLQIAGEQAACAAAAALSAA